MKKLLLLCVLACAPAFAQTAVDTGKAFASFCTALTGAGTSSSSYATYPFNSICQGVFMETWSTCTVDSARSRLLCGGGGHSDYHGNEIYAYYYLTNTWVIVNQPSIWCNNGISGNTDHITGCPLTTSPGIGDDLTTTPACTQASPQGCFLNTSDASPVAHHVWGGELYWPSGDAMFDVSAGTYPSGSDQAFTWAYQFTGSGLGANAVWSWKDPPASCAPLCPLSAEQSSDGFLSALDTVNNTFILYSGTGLLWSYNPAANTYAILNESFPQYTGMTIGFDPLANTGWLFGINAGGTAFQAGYWNMNGSDSYVFHDVTSSATGCSGIFVANTMSPGFDWTPITSTFTGYNQGNMVLSFDPISLNCKTITLAGYSVPSFPVISPPSGIYGKFRSLSSGGMPGSYVYVSSQGIQDTVIMNGVDGPVGLGKSFISNFAGACKDVDGDGYGVGAACLGPDADDTDPTVWTAAQAISKWGSLGAFLNYRQYSTARVWTISPAGNDGTCAVITNPTLIPTAQSCRTFAHVVTNMSPGDTVLVHGTSGTYTSNQLVPASGTATAQTAWVAYPGEQPWIDSGSTSAAGIDMTGGKSYITIDGIAAENSLGTTGCIGFGNVATGIVIENTETKNCNPGGIIGFDGLSNIAISGNVQDSQPDGQHGIYLGSRTHPSSNVRVYNNISDTNQSYPGIQWNGRVTNLFMEGNWSLNNPGAACFSWEEGVSNSIARNNVCMNSASGFQIVNYDGDCYIGSGTSGICPYNQTGNAIENNTLIVGSVDSSGAATALAALTVENLSTGCPTSWFNSVAYLAGNTVLYPFGATGGTVYTALTSTTGNNPASSPADWSAGSGCTMTKQGSLGSNLYRNNIFVNDNGGTNNYSSVSFPMCTEATQPLFNALCVLDTGDTSLSSSTFTNNIFWSTGAGASGALSTGPNPGFGFTSHTCGALASLTTLSGCTNSDPLLTAVSPNAYYNTPASFNLKPLASSPAIGAGTYPDAIEPSIDFAGAARPSGAVSITLGALLGSLVGSGSAFTLSGGTGISGGVVIH